MDGIVSVEIDEIGLKQLEMLQGFDSVATQEFKGAMMHAVNIGKQVTVSDMVSLAEANRAAMRGSLGSGIEPLAPVNPASPGRNLDVTVAVNGPGDVIGVIGPHSGTAQMYIRTTQQGRAPGRIPGSRKLEVWAENVLGVVPKPPKVTKRGKNAGKSRPDNSAGRAIAIAIGQKGIRPSPSFEKSLLKAKARIDAVFAESLVKIAAKLGFK